MISRVLCTLLWLGFFSGLNGQICDLDMESFTGSSSANPPAGWTRGPGTNIGNVYGEVGEVAVGFNNVGEFMISKAYVCAGQVCFETKSSGKSSKYDVEISIAPTSLGTNWTSIGHVITVGGVPGQNVFHQVCLDIPESDLYAPFEVYIKWEMVSRKSGTFYLDDVCVDSGSCQVVPTQLTFTKVPNGCKEVNAPFVVRVCATDANGYIAETYQDNITVSGNNISGTLSADAVNGCFDATIMLSAEGDYTLYASSIDNTLHGLSSVINLMTTCPNEDTLTIMSYNLLNYPDGRNDCGPNTVVPNRWDTLQNILQYVQPDILMVCELQNKFGSDQIHSISLNFPGAPNYEKAQFVVNQSTAATAFNNMMFYNADKVTLLAQEEIETNTRDFNKYTVMANDPGLASHGDTTFIDFYMAHLKAGGAVPDRARRAEDCIVLRDYLDMNLERNNVLGGDLNFYTDQEAAYQTLISGTFPFKDPVNMEGEWDGDFAYATVLTQSSREPGAANYDCGFGGGNDSRFDFLMTSESILNETMNVSYIPDSYTPVGNNGSIFNKKINDPANTSGVPMDVLKSLYYMSDHLPVVMDLKVTYPSTSLPIVWKDIKVVSHPDYNEIKWSIASEINTDHYEIEVRYENDISFSRIAKEDAHVTSNTVQTYKVKDKWVDRQGTYYYRIKAIDLDGASTYSKVVPVNVRRIVSSDIINIYPNPASDEVEISYVLANDEKIKIALESMDGRTRLIAYDDIQTKGNHSLLLDISELPKGIYIVRSEIGDDTGIHRLVLIGE